MIRALLRLQTPWRRLPLILGSAVFVSMVNGIVLHTLRENGETMPGLGMISLLLSSAVAAPWVMALDAMRADRRSQDFERVLPASLGTVLTVRRAAQAATLLLPLCIASLLSLTLGGATVGELAIPALGVLVLALSILYFLHRADVRATHFDRVREGIRSGSAHGWWALLADRRQRRIMSLMLLGCVVYSWIDRLFPTTGHGMLLFSAIFMVNWAGIGRAASFRVGHLPISRGRIFAWLAFPPLAMGLLGTVLPLPGPVSAWNDAGPGEGRVRVVPALIPDSPSGNGVYPLIEVSAADWEFRLFVGGDRLAAEGWHPLFFAGGPALRNPWELRPGVSAEEAATKLASALHQVQGVDVSPAELRPFFHPYRESLLIDRQLDSFLGGLPRTSTGREGDPLEVMLGVILIWFVGLALLFRPSPGARSPVRRGLSVLAWAMGILLLLLWFAMPLLDFLWSSSLRHYPRHTNPFVLYLLPSWSPGTAVLLASLVMFLSFLLFRRFIRCGWSPNPFGAGRAVGVHHSGSGRG